MRRREAGFTLIELIAIIVILGVIGITISSRLPDGDIAAVQSSRDDLIAALFFAQQKAMAQDDISLQIRPGLVSVTRSGNPFRIGSDGYPLSFASGVTASPSADFTYDKRGTITDFPETEDGNLEVELSKGGTKAKITIERSGYAYQSPR